MRPTETQKQMLKITAEIMKRLDTIEDAMAFAVKASARFRNGQRVQFSPAAIRKNIAKRVKGGVRKGRVVKVSDGWTMTVLLDGYKQPHSYHHSFFNPAR